MTFSLGIQYNMVYKPLVVNRKMLTFSFPKFQNKLDITYYMYCNNKSKLFVDDFSLSMLYCLQDAVENHQLSLERKEGQLCCHGNRFVTNQTTLDFIRQTKYSSFFMKHVLQKKIYVKKMNMREVCVTAMFSLFYSVVSLLS